MKKATLTLVLIALVKGLSAQIGTEVLTRNGYTPKTRNFVNHIQIGAVHKYKNVYNLLHGIIGVERNTVAGFGYSFRLKTEQKKHSPVMGFQSSVIFSKGNVPDYRGGVAFGGQFSDKYFFTVDADYSTLAKGLIFSLNLGIKIHKDAIPLR